MVIMEKKMEITTWGLSFQMGSSKQTTVVGLVFAAS